MVKLYSCRAHDGDYFWLRYKHTEERLYHKFRGVSTLEPT